MDHMLKIKEFKNNNKNIQSNKKKINIIEVGKKKLREF